MNRTSKVLKNIVWEIGYYIVVFFIGCMVPRYVILIYGSEINGLSATITQFLNMILLIQSGATTAAVYSLFKPVADRDVRGISVQLALAGKYFKKIAWVFLFIMILFATLTAFFIDSEISGIHVFTAFFILGMKNFLDLYFVSKFRAIFTAYQEKFFISIATLLEQIVYYGLLFVVLWFQLNFLGMYVCLIVGGIFRIVYLQRLFSRVHPDIAYLHVEAHGAMINGKNYAFANEVSHSIVALSPVIIISFFCNLNDASIYSVYMVVLNALNLICIAVYSAFAPSFGNVIACNDIERAIEVFSVFLFGFNFLNTMMMICTMYLIVPFVEIYTNGVTDIVYANTTIAVLLVINGLLWGYRIPYNILVSSYGLFKETWRQPVVTAVVSLMVSVLISKYSYAYVLAGPIIFYSVNFFYQHWLLGRLKPEYINARVFLMLLISLSGVAIAAEWSFWAGADWNIKTWLASALLTIVSAFVYLYIMANIFLKKDLLSAEKILLSRYRRRA